MFQRGINSTRFLSDDLQKIKIVQDDTGNEVRLGRQETEELFSVLIEMHRRRMKEIKGEILNEPTQ